MMMLRWSAAAIFLAGLTFYAFAQEDRHAQGHESYMGWSSQKTANCCNNQDCKWLDEKEWREGANGPEVQIEGQWCPVKPEHFIIKGKSPDWTKAHACINRRAYNMPPCERLLCFVGIPKG